jgi:hypothetical protein
MFNLVGNVKEYAKQHYCIRKPYTVIHIAFIQFTEE